MRSSYRIIKNEDVLKDNMSRAIIETKILGPVKKEVMEGIASEEAMGEEGDKLLEETRRDMLLKLEEEKLTILANAKKQAEAMVVEARKKGQAEGFDLGYEEGISKAREDAKLIKAKALKLLADSEDYVSDYYEKTKEDLIKLAGQMAQSIVHHIIDTSNEDVLLLIKPILERYGGGESVIITCNPSKIPIMRSKVAELESLWEDTRFVILEDGNLEENGCTIENQFQYIDLQIGKQIENIVEEINSME